MRGFSRVITLHFDDHVVKSRADHPFYTSHGWVDAADLRAGDLLRTRDGSWTTIEVEERPDGHQLVPCVMPYLVSGLLPAGRLILTANGLKKIGTLPENHVVCPKSFFLRK